MGENNHDHHVSGTEVQAKRAGANSCVGSGRRRARPALAQVDLDGDWINVCTSCKMNPWEEENDDP
jgi:hypothetical protein